MDKNLFEQAKDMMMNLGNDKENHQNHMPEDKEAVRKAIQSAYNEATLEEKTQLEQFEQQLDEKIDLH